MLDIIVMELAVGRFRFLTMPFAYKNPCTVCVDGSRSNDPAIASSKNICLRCLAVQLVIFFMLFKHLVDFTYSMVEYLVSQQGGATQKKERRREALKTFEIGPFALRFSVVVFGPSALRFFAVPVLATIFCPVNMIAQRTTRRQQQQQQTKQKQNKSSTERH